MRKRVAEKILKHREKLNYSQEQIRKAEETLGEVEKLRTGRETEKTESLSEKEE